MKRAVGMVEYLIQDGHEVAIVALDCKNIKNRLN
jgi:hypothetical protein